MNVEPMTQGPLHHFFGYYGVDAWDPANQRHLALETDFDDHRPLSTGSQGERTHSFCAHTQISLAQSSIDQPPLAIVL